VSAGKVVRLASDKDQLIAWAYRYFWMHAGVTNEDDASMVAFPSSVIEYFQACERVMPNVRALSEQMPYHADHIGLPAGDIQ
jgi:hypothetical protein